jgi:hypothetical protein
LSRSTQQLIESLAKDLEPVRRLRPPLVRAVLWLAIVASVAAVLLALFAHLDIFLGRWNGHALEMISPLLTGILGVLAAFHISIPGRSRWWLAAPLPALAVWLATSGYGCYRHWLEQGADGWHVGNSGRCFMFILAVSVPLALFLFFMLRSARPLIPRQVASMGALGVAGLAAFLLQFFHPFDVTFMDLGLHVAAVVVVIASSALLARPALGAA